MAIVGGKGIFVPNTDTKENQGWSDNAGTPRKRRVGWTDGIRPGKPRSSGGIQDEGGMNVNPDYNTY